MLITVGGLVVGYAVYVLIVFLWHVARAGHVMRPKRLQVRGEKVHVQAAPGYEAEVWFGIFGPSGIPKDIVSALNQCINDAQRDPDIVERYRVTGQAAFVVTPEQLADTVRRNYETWSKLLKELGLKIQ